MLDTEFRLRFDIIAIIGTSDQSGWPNLVKFYSFLLGTSLVFFFLT